MDNWKAIADSLLFDFGKSVLGKNSGGMIAKLKASRGIEGAQIALRLALSKQDPREYIGAVLKDKDSGGVRIGDCLGNYVWTGSRWKPNER